jgi:prefoldin beta subunit
MELDKTTQLQLLHQQLQQISFKKQQTYHELTELESALKEITPSEKVYKIVGKVMFLTTKEQLVKDLEEKKEDSKIRLESINSQEKSLQEMINKLQEEVLKSTK